MISRNSSVPEILKGFIVMEDKEDKIMPSDDREQIIRCYSDEQAF